MKPNSIGEEPYDCKNGADNGWKRTGGRTDEDQNEDDGRDLLTQKNWPTLFQ
jgi:hypothetical protein